MEPYCTDSVILKIKKEIKQNNKKEWKSQKKILETMS